VARSVTTRQKPIGSVPWNRPKQSDPARERRSVSAGIPAAQYERARKRPTALSSRRRGSVEIV
jgi:hypothetical protein